MSFKSFLRGVGSVLNIFGSGERRRISVPRRTMVMDYEEARKADAEALQGDWQAVGDDMRAAINKTKPYDKNGFPKRKDGNGI